MDTLSERLHIILSSAHKNGQIITMLETTLGNLYHWKELLVMAPPVQAVNRMMININSTMEIDIDIEVTKAKIKPS